jgi:hypothetical protein
MPYIKSATPQKDYNFPGVTDVYSSGNVFINGTQVALWDAPGNAESFVLAAIASPSFEREKAVFEIDGEEDEAIVSAKQQELIKQGVITQYELDKGANAGANPAKSDTGASTAGPGDTTGSATLASQIDETLLYDGSSTSGIKWYVKTVTKQPYVIFPYDVATVAPQNGTTVQAVCDALRLLVKNCLDPIKTKYKDALITCTFRKAGVGATTSQHPKGMAADIQYSSASKADYYTRALWVRDNIPFDQFILEYKTTGTGKPWHHISFSASGNRQQVLTFMNDKNCKGPGVTGLYDLSNT